MTCPLASFKLFVDRFKHGPPELSPLAVAARSLSVPPPPSLTPPRPLSFCLSLLSLTNTR